jgi:hypothetical protein
MLLVARIGYLPEVLLRLLVDIATLFLALSLGARGRCHVEMLMAWECECRSDEVSLEAQYEYE